MDDRGACRRHDCATRSIFKANVQNAKTLLEQQGACTLSAEGANTAPTTTARARAVHASARYMRL